MLETQAEAETENPLLAILAAHVGLTYDLVVPVERLNRAIGVQGHAGDVVIPRRVSWPIERGRIRGIERFGAEPQPPALRNRELTEDAQVEVADPRPVQTIEASSPEASIRNWGEREGIKVRLAPAVAAGDCDIRLDLVRPLIITGRVQGCTRRRHAEYRP